MKIVLEEAEVKSAPKAVREYILELVYKKCSSDAPQPFLKGFLGDGTGRGNRSLLYAGVAARDGEWCAQCGETENLEVDYIVPLNLGGHATVDNAQLLCRKHHAIKGHRRGDITRIDAISVEASIAILEGLSDRSKNVLRAMVSLGVPSGIQRSQLMEVPDFQLKFKDGRSLNGVLTGIRKRFRSLVQEGERNSVDLLEYDDVKDTYALGQGSYWALKKAFSYIGSPDEYLKISEIDKRAVNLYRQGAGQVIQEFKLGGANLRMDTALVLPDIGPKSPSNEPLSLREHFPFDSTWTVYGGDSEVKGDD